MAIRTAYTSNLLGTIKSHLEGLQGYDVMALELIQNADDAGATEIVFKITDNSLKVWNSGDFTYCGQLDQRPCPHSVSKKYACDFHRIIDVASGGKLARSENIGRFGIGFVSTYQVTDSPEIHSNQLKVILRPEIAEVIGESISKIDGTLFVLPWAFDPNSQARVALGISHLTLNHIQRLKEDFEKVLRQSLFFLRHVKKAELHHDGELIFGCEIDRSEDNSELLVSFHPSKTTESWYILRIVDEDTVRYGNTLNSIYQKYPKLIDFKRNTLVSVAVRMKPEPLEKGYLYAYLPTEQPTGLPLHINADFFPEADRKNIIFAGGQHQQEWNELLIKAAGWVLMSDLEGKRDKIGYAQLLEVISKSLTLTQNQSNYPACYSNFWVFFKQAVGNQKAKIAMTIDGTFEHPANVLLLPHGFEQGQVNILQKLGAKLAHEDLRPHRNALIQLGAKDLTLERMVELMETSLPLITPSDAPIDAEYINDIYLPLWKTVEELLPKASDSANIAILRLKKLSFVLSQALFPVSIDECYSAPEPLMAEKVAPLLWWEFTHDRLKQFPKIFHLTDVINLSIVTFALIQKINAGEKIEKIIGSDKAKLRSFYSLLAQLDQCSSPPSATYQNLRSLPIWLTGKGFSTAGNTFLPGNFTDPTGQANLINPELLDFQARVFVETKIGIESQTIEAYVRTFVPQFFGNIDSVDLAIYQRLIAELANHRILIDDDSLRNLLAGLRMVPTQTGKWSRPIDAYYYTNELAAILGDNKALWIDQKRLISERSVRSFFENIGIRKIPSAEHLVERIIQCARDSKPNNDAKKASERAFYELCRRYDQSKDQWRNNNNIQQALRKLKDTPCLPSDSNEEKWYKPSDLYVFYRSEGFASQATILAFKDPRQLNSNLLIAIGVSMEPRTGMVVNHLLYCMKNNVPAHPTIYQILNERSSDPDISRLIGESCICLSINRYIRPNQLYWLPQNLGEYAFTIPDSLQQYRSLFKSLGVKNEPSPQDYVEILIDIVKSLPVKAITGSDRSFYDTCLRSIANAEQNELDEATWQQLKDHETIINLEGYPHYPDDIILNDSEWHSNFFQHEIDRLLCKFGPEYWSLLKTLGVKKISESAKINLEYYDGDSIDEVDTSEELHKRQKIVAIVLNDKSSTVKRDVMESIKRIKVRSYEKIRIQATVQLGTGSCSASPVITPAFYDQANNTLIVARPVDKDSWVYIFSALLHPLAPNEAASEIAAKASHLSLLMPFKIEEAIKNLKASGMSMPVDEEDQPLPLQLESKLIDGIGMTGDLVEGLSNTPVEFLPLPEEHTPSSFDNPPTHINLPPEVPRTKPSAPTPVFQPAKMTTKQKHKVQRDEELISYVRNIKEKWEFTFDPDQKNTHNLAVEVASRKVVCKYERDRMRRPIEMLQTHPGYDIISHSLSTDEVLRYIEVKGIDGEWNKTGVGLSRTQFCNAQDFGDQYWLYIVEHAFDPSQYCIYPIQNPASKVDKFMYNSGWKGVISEEPSNPAAGFVPGAKVDCGPLGIGEIIELITENDEKILIIDFAIGGKKALAFDFGLMQIIEQD